MRHIMTGKTPEFYINCGKHCAQTAIKSVVTGETFSLRELDRLTGRYGNQVTVPIQMAYAFDKLGVDFFYPVKKSFLEDDLDTLKEKTKVQFGDEILKKTNVGFISLGLDRLRKGNKYKVYESFDISDIQSEILNNRVPICLINYDIFVQRENKFSGHYLIINCIGDTHSEVMDSGPSNASPNRKILTKRLEESLMGTPIDYGVIFVS